MADGPPDVCGNESGHSLRVPASWLVTWPNGEHNQAFACEDCLDICIELAWFDRKALLLEPLPVGSTP